MIGGSYFGQSYFGGGGESSGAPVVGGRSQTLVVHLDQAVPVAGVAASPTNATLAARDTFAALSMRTTDAGSFTWLLT